MASPRILPVVWWFCHTWLSSGKFRGVTRCRSDAVFPSLGGRCRDVQVCSLESCLLRWFRFYHVMPPWKISPLAPVPQMDLHMVCLEGGNVYLFWYKLGCLQFGWNAWFWIAMFGCRDGGQLSSLFPHFPHRSPMVWLMVRGRDEISGYE